MKSTETIYFWRCLLVNGFSGAITFTRITMRFSILPPCIKLCASKVLDAKRNMRVPNNLESQKVIGPRQASLASAAADGDVVGVRRRTTGSGRS
jgi:hypothetical protein